MPDTMTPGITGEITLTPHPYQYEALLEIEKARLDYPSSLVVMPTGTGKTFVQMLQARMTVEEGGRVLYLVHTSNLVQQAAAATQLAGLDHAIEKADSHACPHLTRGHVAGFLPDADPRLVIGSVATLRGDRLRAWPTGHFDLVIVDEAHHTAAGSYRKIIEHLAPKHFTGYTATPDRADGQPIVGKNQIFAHLAYEYRLADAVKNGFLKRPRFNLIDVNVDLKELGRKGMRDWSDEDVEKALLPHVEEIANELRPHIEGRFGVVFTPLVRSAQAVSDALRSLGVRSDWVSGDDPDRDGKIVSHRRGDLDCLVNAMLLTEGYDARHLDYVVVLRATKSRALLVQMIGRALRSHPGKEAADIYAVRWETLKAADLCHPTRIFDSLTGPKLDEDVQKEAARITDAGDEPDLMEAIAQATKNVEVERKRREAEEQRKKLKIEARKARVRVYRFDPLNLGPDFLPPPSAHGKSDPMATDRQINALTKFGLPERDVVEWTRAYASSVLDKLFKRAKAGLCTYKQSGILRQFGVNPEHVSKAEASQIIDRLFNKRPAEVPAEKVFCDW